MPVYGFNFGAYDLNIVKRYLFHLPIKNNEKIGNISKTEKQWIHCIKTELGNTIEKNVTIDNTVLIDLIILTLCMNSMFGIHEYNYYYKED